MMSKIYPSNDQIEDLQLLKPGNIPFFRKLTDNYTSERQIYQIIATDPHPNIVTVYDINYLYVDIELVNTDISKPTTPNEILVFVKTATKLKQFLQQRGIAYIDWKIDNFGMNSAGKYKLFDFDMSGIFDTNTNMWIVTPEPGFLYKDAVNHGFITPVDIDNFIFDKFINQYLFE